jgi:hypothetical protein
MESNERVSRKINLQNRTMSHCRRRPSSSGLNRVSILNADDGGTAGECLIVQMEYLERKEEGACIFRSGYLDAGKKRTDVVDRKLT